MEIVSAQTNDSAVVRKPAGTTHFANKYTIQERKLLNVCLWNAQSQGFKRKSFEMPTSAVRELIGGTETRNYVWLKDVTRGLLGKVIEWNSTGKDKTSVWEACTFLTSAKIQNGKFTYRLNEVITEQLENPRLWGKFKLLAQINIKRKHALIIYEFLSTELSIAGSNTQEIKVRISVDDLREICGLSDGQYEQFKDFNKLVLLPAKQEIDKHTDVIITYEGIRNSRKIDELVFNVQRKKHFQFSLPGFDDLPAVRNFSPENADEETLQLLNLLEQVGVSKRQASRLVGKFAPDRIKRNLAYCEKQMQKSKIDNMPAYIVKAIESDYQPGPTAKQITEAEKVRDSVRKMATVEADKGRAKEHLNEFEQFQYTRTRELFAEMSKSWQDKRRAAFKADPGDAGFMVKERLAKDEWDSAIVSSAFFGRLRSELLTAPHEKSFEKYLLWKRKNAA